MVMLFLFSGYSCLLVFTLGVFSGMKGLIGYLTLHWLVHIQVSKFSKNLSIPMY